MNKENVLYGVIGLLLGVVIALATSHISFSRHYKGMMSDSDNRMMQGKMHSMMGEDSDIGMDSAMQNMMQGLENKSADDFDKAFLSEMTTHHQGAIDMANAALKNAKHQEIKTMANNIISAQTKEINQIKEWQKTWYK